MPSLLRRPPIQRRSRPERVQGRSHRLCCTSELAQRDRPEPRVPRAVFDANLDASLALPAWKLFAINELRYGTNAKMMVGFDRRPWLSQGSSGQSYSDLPNHQTTWETNPAKATDLRAVMTDYSGGARGASLDPKQVQTEAMRFLSDLDRVYPGASRPAGNLRVHLEHWPSNPLVKGSYTSNHPGYFRTIADNEAKPVGNLYFAGEHTSSFYEYQGFMEGAAFWRSGSA